MTEKLIILVGIAMGLKIVFNIYYFLVAKHYYAEYVAFIKGKKSWFVKEHKQRIINLFKRAGIKDAFQPSTEPTGYGMLATSKFSVFQNLSVLRGDIVEIINGDFRETLGVFKQRVFETLNPFYWAETILLLPRVILEYLGVKSASVIIKIFQLLWWVVGAISILVGIFFNHEFISWVKHIW